MAILARMQSDRNSYLALLAMQTLLAMLKKGLAASSKLTLPHDLAILPLGIYSKDISAFIYPNTLHNYG